MNPRPGRNDLCYCGSGKKYKKCHLPEDEARERELLRARVEAQTETTPPHLNPRPSTDGTPLDLPPWDQDSNALPILPPPEQDEQPSPEGQALNERWEAFEAAGYDEQIRLFEGWVAAGEVDAELAFDMLDTLHAGAVERGERGRFRGLVAFLRERAPDLYDEDQIWYLSWLIEDAAVEGAYERIPALVGPLANLAERNIDEVFRLIDLLMFHDQVEPLIDMMSRAWPSVSRSGEILPGGIAEFAVLLTMLHLYRHLDQGGVPRVDAPALRDALAPIAALDDRQLQQVLDALSGTVVRDWSPDDFSHDDDEGRTPEQEEQARGLDESHEEGAGQARETPSLLEQNLFLLTLEWAGGLHRERGVPFSRIEVVRDALIRFLLMLPPERAGRARLLPDKRAVDGQLAALMSFLSGQYYKAGALFALLPDYIDMLVARGLVKRDAGRRARADILTLRGQVRTLVADGTHDPALIEAVERAGD